MKEQITKLNTGIQDALDNALSEASFKPFKQIKKGDIVNVDKKETATVVATGSFKSLLKYDDSGVAADAIESGEVKPNEESVAIQFKNKEMAVYPYSDMSTMFMGIESMEKEQVEKEIESIEEAKKKKAEEMDVEIEKDDSEEEIVAEGSCEKKESEDEEMSNEEEEESIEESKKSKTESEDEEMDEEEESIEESKKSKTESEDEEMDEEEESIEESKKSKTESEDEEIGEEEEEIVAEGSCEKKESEDEEMVDEEENEEEEMEESVDHIETITSEVSERVSTESTEQNDINVEESLSGLIDGDSTLSEEFRSKAAIIFEAAVSEKVADKVESIRAEYESSIREQVEQQFTSVVEKVDNYLSYAIEAWIQDNSESVDAKLRTEITESFISNLKDVFEKHYIEMPEGKLDLYDDLSTKANEIQEKFDAQTETLKSITEELVSLKRASIIREASEDLYDTQADRLSKLTDNLEFVDEETFKKKVSIIKETYFKDNGKSEDETEVKESSNSKVSTTTIIEEDEDTSELSDIMGKYVRAISRHSNGR